MPVSMPYGLRIAKQNQALDYPIGPIANLNPQCVMTQVSRCTRRPVCISVYIVLFFRKTPP